MMRAVDGGSAEQLAIDGGRSAALAQALRTVAEADLGAGPKYPAVVIQELTRTISTRAYGRPLLELMHLIRIAEAAGGRHGWPAVVFAVPVARATAFRGIIQRAAPGCRAFASDFTLVEDGVEIAYPDGVFRVTYGRMAFLAALVEFAITALGWRAVDGVLRGWLEDRFALRAASTHANALSRLLYDHLKQHLPTAQALRGYRRLTRFLAATRGDGFRLEDLDDAAVLAFWCHPSGGEGAAAEVERGAVAGGDARTFRAALEQVARLRGAMQAGFERRALDAATPLGSDRLAGEVDPDILLGVLEAHDAAGDPLRRLADPPASTVKFLTGRETEALDLMAALGPHGPALPLSVLRAETFGAAQARLTQAIRRRADPAELAALAGLAGCESYEGRIAYWNRLDRQLARIALAALAVLVEAGRPEAAAELLAHVPDADLSGLRAVAIPDGDGPAGGGTVTLLLAGLGDRSLVGRRTAALAAEARAALRAVTRQGFGAGERRRPGAADGFAAGAPAVRAARDLLDRVRRAVDRAVPAALREAGFERDRVVFTARLRALYEVVS